ncbi:MAG: Ig-like domain-containing protein [Longimicrobiales bacterium]
MIVASALLVIAAAQDPQQAARIVVEPATLALAVDATRQLVVRGLDSTGARIALPDPVRWLSSDVDIVTVDAQGTVTARGPGTARVTAMVAGIAGFADITVQPLPAATIEATLPFASIATGTSAAFEVVARDRDGRLLRDVAFRFESTAPNVARVDANGRVSGRSAGNAVVRITAGQAITQIPVRVVNNVAVTYTLSADRQTARTGDVIRLRASGLDRADREVVELAPAWVMDRGGATLDAEGRQGVFVAEEAGQYAVSALIGDTIVRSMILDITPRTAEAELRAVGRGPTTGHHAGDTWAFEGVDGHDYAYIGTFLHDWMKAFDITDPANPILTDSIQLDARRINDVKIHPNNRIAVVTREGASSRRNGIVVLDLSVPAHPTILSEYTETVTGGVHNVWIDGETDLVYACHNGTGSMHIIDISDPRNPREVGRWGLEKESKTLHDVFVKDGYAYLSYWDDGAIMLDVGAGSHGGTPTAPAFVSQFRYPEGNTHVAWRDGKYLYVGDEIFPDDWDASRPIEARGFIHVLDYTDPENPREVATYEVPEAGTHNVWVENDLLYVGYYQGGLRVVDVSGELRGDLYRQGRELAALRTGAPDAITPNWSMTWGAQVFKGHIITSDLNSGLWVARLELTRPVS